MRALIIIMAIVLLGLVGKSDMEETIIEMEYHQEMVSSGYWPDINGEYK